MFELSLNETPIYPLVKPLISHHPTIQTLPTEEILLAYLLFSPTSLDTRSPEQKANDLNITNDRLSLLLNLPNTSPPHPFNLLRDILTRSSLKSNEAILTAQLAQHALKTNDAASARIVFDRVDKANQRDQQQTTYQQLLRILIDAVQRHITDPQALKDLYQELNQVAQQLNQ